MIGLFDLSTIPFYLEHIAYDRSVWFVHNHVLMENIISMIGLFDLSTIPF